MSLQTKRLLSGIVVLTTSLVAVLPALFASKQHKAAPSRTSVRSGSGTSHRAFRLICKPGQIIDGLRISQILTFVINDRGDIAWTAATDKGFAVFMNNHLVVSGGDKYEVGGVALNNAGHVAYVTNSNDYPQVVKLIVNGATVLQEGTVIGDATVTYIGEPALNDNDSYAVQATVTESDKDNPPHSYTCWIIDGHITPIDECTTKTLLFDNRKNISWYQSTMNVPDAVCTPAGKHMLPDCQGMGTIINMNNKYQFVYSPPDPSGIGRVLTGAGGFLGFGHWGVINNSGTVVIAQGQTFTLSLIATNYANATAKPNDADHPIKGSVIFTNAEASTLISGQSDISMGTSWDTTSDPAMLNNAGQIAFLLDTQNYGRVLIGNIPAGAK